jgi:hypothetical protein
MAKKKQARPFRLNPLKIETSQKMLILIQVQAQFRYETVSNSAKTNPPGRGTYWSRINTKILTTPMETPSGQASIP